MENERHNDAARPFIYSEVSQEEIEANIVRCGWDPKKNKGNTGFTLKKSDYNPNVNSAIENLLRVGIITEGYYNQYDWNITPETLVKWKDSKLEI